MNIFYFTEKNIGTPRSPQKWFRRFEKGSK